MKKTWQYFCLNKNRRPKTHSIPERAVEAVIYNFDSNKFRQGTDEAWAENVFIIMRSVSINHGQFQQPTPMSHLVLLIDDDQPFRRALRLYLENCGFTCQEANDGLDALSLLDRGLNVDLIVSDYHMPIINGLNLLKALSYRANGQNVRVILLSGNMTKNMEDEAKQAGAFEVLAKPYDHQELLALVSRACKK
jgi:CheY-like chemotaxis protein